LCIISPNILNAFPVPTNSLIPRKHSSTREKGNLSTLCISKKKKSIISNMVYLSFETVFSKVNKGLLGTSIMQVCRTTRLRLGPGGAAFKELQPGDFTGSKSLAPPWALKSIYHFYKH